MSTVQIIWPSQSAISSSRYLVGIVMRFLVSSVIALAPLNITLFLLCDLLRSTISHFSPHCYSLVSKANLCQAMFVKMIPLKVNKIKGFSEVDEIVGLCGSQSQIMTN